ncbi:MAG: SHOCT-like domain-containing protein [Erysipelotrichaceae bacterium]
MKYAQQILDMVKEGTISHEQAQELLEACQEQEQAVVVTPKWLEIRVSGSEQVNVKLPIRLVEMGLQISKTMVKDEEAASMLSSINLKEILSMIARGEEGLPFTLVDVNDETNNKQVKIQVV